jgi:hypothetical protein
MAAFIGLANFNLGKTVDVNLQKSGVLKIEQWTEKSFLPK